MTTKPVRPMITVVASAGRCEIVLAELGFYVRCLDCSHVDGPIHAKHRARMAGDSHKCPAAVAALVAARVAELREQRDNGNDYGKAEARELSALTGEPLRLPGQGSHDEERCPQCGALPGRDDTCDTCAGSDSQWVSPVPDPAGRPSEITDL